MTLCPRADSSRRMSPYTWWVRVRNRRVARTWTGRQTRPARARRGSRTASPTRLRPMVKAAPVTSGRTSDAASEIASTSCVTRETTSELSEDSTMSTGSRIAVVNTSSRSAASTSWTRATSSRPPTRARAAPVAATSSRATPSAVTRPWPDPSATASTRPPRRGGVARVTAVPARSVSSAAPSRRRWTPSRRSSSRRVRRGPAMGRVAGTGVTGGFRSVRGGRRWKRRRGRSRRRDRLRHQHRHRRRHRYRYRHQRRRRGRRPGRRRRAGCRWW